MNYQKERIEDLRKGDLIALLPYNSNPPSVLGVYKSHTKHIDRELMEDSGCDEEDATSYRVFFEDRDYMDICGTGGVMVMTEACSNA